MIDLNKVERNLFLSTLLRIYAYTECDTVSSFSSQGKIKPMNLMSKHQSNIEFFSSLGKSWDLFESNITNLEKFTCHLYGYQSDTIKLLSYNLYCSKKESIDKLPPCKSSLIQHCSSANYQWHVWGLSLETCPTITSPDDYGWTIDNNEISISGCLVNLHRKR